MARHASALKAARQAEKHRSRNQARLADLRTAVKKLREAAAKKYANKEEAKEVLTGMLSQTQRTLMKAASKKIIKSGKASRTISRLSSRVDSATS